MSKGKMDYLANMEILSLEECSDKDYGESLIQYSFGEGHVAFSFCDVDVTRKGYDLEQIKEDVLDRLNGNFEKPLWSDLSEDLRYEIIESQFDMRFIEYDWEDWSQEKADKIHEEVMKHSLGDSIMKEVDDCYLTFYAGVMGEVNWAGHPEYGVPCLEKVIEPEKGLALKDKISAAESKVSGGGKDGCTKEAELTNR